MQSAQWEKKFSLDIENEGLQTDHHWKPPDVVTDSVMKLLALCSTAVKRSKSLLGIFRWGTKSLIIPLHIPIYAHFECSTDYSHLKVSRLKLKKI